MSGDMSLFLLLVALNVADVWMTYRALKLGAREANPVARWLFDRVGFWPAALTIKAAVLALVYDADVPMLTLAGVGIYAVVFVRNGFALRDLEARVAASRQSGTA